MTTDTATKALRVRVNNVVTRDDYRAVTAAMRGSKPWIMCVLWRCRERL
ncbi:MAG: hypothetical protein CM15mP92_1220 [Halieaceae bacterium]|nr:MAG: hypothetical protein CM15mP92_1220 [Halieaceae bacterium]